MPRKADSERYGEWAEKINERVSYVRQKQDKWSKYLRYYRMELTEEEAPEGDTVWVNHQFGLSRVVLPSIYYRNPDVMVSPRMVTPLEYSNMLESLLNFQLGTIDFEGEMRKLVMDAFFMGIGVMKFGYAPVIKEEGGERELAEAATGLFDEEYWEGPKAPKSAFEPNQLITDTDPFAVRIHPKFFYIDPLATTLDDARWVAHGILMPVEEAKKKKHYQKSVISGIQGDHKLSDNVFINEIGAPRSYSERMPKFYQDLVMIYEIWDREKNELLVIDSYNMDKGDKRFLRKETNPYDINGFPFDLLVFNADPESPYGVSDAEVLENPIDALNLINSMHYNHVKRFHRKYVVAEDMPDDEIDKLISPFDGAVLKARGVSTPSDAVHPIADAPMTPDAYTLRNTLRDEITTLSGVTEQRRGGSEKSKTATEASIIEQQARVRDSDRLYIVTKFVERAAERILLLDRQYLDSSYVAFITGQEALTLWEQKAPEILKAQVDVKVRVGSSAFVSREVKNKQLLDFFNLVAPLVDPATGQPIANLREFILRIADGMDIDDAQKLLNPPQPPIPQLMPQAGQQQVGGGGGGMQKPALRTGAPNLGNMLSGVQNLGARRTPNPTGGELG